MLTLSHRIRFAALLVVAGACARRDTRPESAAIAAPASHPSGAIAAADTGRRAAASDTVLERADRARITGSANAPVWMVIVSDFQCPYCKTWHDSTLPAIRREYVATGKIRMAYINLPLPMHPHAWPAAETAMCAGLQGRFWEMGDKLFETQPGWEQLPKVEPYFDSLATSVGVQLPALHSCLAAHTTRPLIQSDYDRSVAAGVNSTPTFLIGNSMVRGAQPIQNFRAVLDSVIAAAGRSTTR